MDTVIQLAYCGLYIFFYLQVTYVLHWGVTVHLPHEMRHDIGFMRTT